MAFSPLASEKPLEETPPFQTVPHPLQDTREERSYCLEDLSSDVMVMKVCCHWEEYEEGVEHLRKAEAEISRMNVQNSHLQGRVHGAQFLMSKAWEGQTNWKLLTSLYLPIIQILLAVPIPPLMTLSTVNLTRAARQESLCWTAKFQSMGWPCNCFRFSEKSQALFTRLWGVQERHPA